MKGPMGDITTSSSIQFMNTAEGILPFHHRNLDACAPPAPRDPAPLLLRPAQAWLNFGSSPAHLAHPADRAVAGPRPIPLQIVNF
jgi:hypothetical protein